MTANTDVAPGLYDKIRRTFEKAIAEDNTMQKIVERAQRGEIDFEDAYSYAERIGRYASAALTHNLTADALPDGKMYYNIAVRTVRPMLQRGYKMSAEKAAEAQKVQNKENGIGIVGKAAELEDDRVDGIINRMCAEESIDKIDWILKDPVETLMLDAVSDTVKANANLQSRAGITCYITRTAYGKVCKWCRGLVGRYKYHDEPEDVWRRHENCKCRVTFESDKRVKDVHTKAEWQEDASKRKIDYAEKLAAEQAKTRKDAEMRKLTPKLSDAEKEKIISRSKIQIAQLAESGKKPQISASKMEKVIFSEKNKHREELVKAGYSADNWKRLATDIQGGYNPEKAYDFDAFETGRIRYSTNQMLGNDGETYRCVWMQDKSGANPRLLSVYKFTGD